MQESMPARSHEEKHTSDRYFCIISWTNSLSVEQSVRGRSLNIGIHTINPSITILISLSDHLINFIISQFFPNGRHNVTELRSGDETVVISVEDLCSRVSASKLI